MSEERRGPGVVTVVLVCVVVALSIVVVQMLRSSSSSTPGVVVGADAVAAYDAALDAGLPIYILFHSRTCQSCVEIDAVAKVVVPEYEGRVSFVDAITDEDSGMELASSFPFQFIPTSYYLLEDGTVYATYTGVLDADAMREQLDSLLAAD